MTILSDRSIRTAMNLGRLKLEDWSSVIGPASIDVYLSSSFKALHRSAGINLGNDGFELAPGGFVLGSTRETLTLGDDLCAQVAGCSTLARTGIQIESAGFVDPGWHGQLTLEILNMSADPILLVPNQRIAQLVFFQLTTAVERSYADTGRYQNQQGATGARSPRKVGTDDAPGAS
jgi:dCTP deaminase